MNPLARTGIALLLILSAVTLGLGLVGPCLTVKPGFGDLDGWARLMLAPDLTANQSFSILTGIDSLRRQGHTGLALVLLAFSVCFPVLKLALMGYSHAALALGRRAGKSLWFAHHAGKFSMLDVLVVAVIILAIKGMPGDTRVLLSWGLWCFTASVLLAITAALALTIAQRHPAPAG